jgi:predicted enzyme related to lactoylglutathione lyase
MEDRSPDMTDPFAALHTPVVRVDPDPSFSARLRDRLNRAFDLPKGVTVSNLTDLERTIPPDAGPRHGDIGYASLWVPDVQRAAVFFSTVLGWRYRASSGPAGRQVEGLSMHHGLWGGEPRSTLFLCFAVDDVDMAIARVRDAGGTAEEPTFEPFGRVSGCVDDQGVRFAVYEAPGGPATGPAPAPNGSRVGDLAYVTMEVVNSARSRAFYASVLGWRFTPGRADHGWQVEDVAPMVGMHGGHAEATTVPMYRVDDIDAAVGRVRAAAGRATDPEVQPYGTTSECTDDQGTRFYLGRL